MGDIRELLAGLAAAGTPHVLATVVRCEAPTSARPGDKAVITPDGSLTGWIGGSCSDSAVRREALRALADGLPRVLRISGASTAAEVREPHRVTMATTCPSGGALEIFIDPQVPPPVLLAFGDTPVATTIARLAQIVGFQARAVARVELTSLHVPESDAWAVVCTMGHFDEEALEAALAHPGLDVALVASDRRARGVFDGLRARGVAAPAGGSRGASQEEIALAALAEIAALRRQRRGPAAGPRAEQFATDPVCGMAVEVEGAAHTADHERHTYYFCGDGCRRRFLEDPQSFLPAA
jgi:xanthine dehydrogenase accessory factor